MKYLRAYSRSISHVMIVLMTLWQVARPLQAATVYLDTNGATAGSGITNGASVAWDSSALWTTVSDGTGTPAPWAAGDIAAFSAGTDATGSYTVAVGGTQTIGGLVFRSGNVSLTGGTLSLASASTIDVGTGLTAGVSSLLSGAFGLTKTGAGTLTLSGANSGFSGPVLLNRGTLVAQTAPQALGTGALTLAGGSLVLASDTGVAFGNNTTVTGSTGITVDRLTSGAGVTDTLGTLSIGPQKLSIQAGTHVTSGTAGLVFGATTLTANGAIFDVGTTANLTLGAIGGSFNIFKTGAGTLTLNGTSSRTGSTTFVTSGTVVQTNVAGLGTTAATLNLSGGATLDLATDASTTAYPTTLIGNATVLSNVATSGAGITHTLGTITSLGANTLTIGKGANVSTGTAAVVFGNAITTGATNFQVGSGAQFTLGGTVNNAGFTTTFSGAGNSTVTGVLSGGGGVTMNGTGLLTLTAANTYGGITTINSGTVQLGNATSLGAAATAATVMTGSSTFNTNGLAVSLMNLSGTSGTVLQNGHAATAATLTLTTGANATSNFAGTIQNGGAGTMGITLNGTGALTLSGNNSYTGATTLTAGRLNINSATALGGSASVFTLTTGIIDNTGGGAVVLSNNNAITLGPLGFTFGGSNSLSFGSGALTASSSASRTIVLMGNTGSNLQIGTYNTAFATALTTTVRTLPGSNSILTIGTYNPQASGTAVATVLAGNSNITITNGIVPTIVTSAMNFSNTGTLTLRGTSTYTGSTSFTAGNVVLDATGGVATMAAASPPTFAGGTFTFKGNNTGTGQTLGAVTGNAGGSTLKVVGGAAGTTLTLGGTTVSANNGTLNIILDSTAGAAVATTTSTTATNGILGAASARAAVVVTIGNSTEFATLSASGTNRSFLQYTAQTPFTGATTGTATNYSVTGSQTLTTAASTPNSVKINTSASGQSLDLGANTMQITTGGLLFVGANDYEIKGTSATALRSATATNSDLIVHNYGTGELNISAIIANGTGASVVTLSGPGVTRLSGVNTYTGITYVTGGSTLSIAANSALGAVATGAGLTLNNGTLRTTSTFALDNAGANIRAIALGAGGGTFDVASGTTLSVLGVISSTGSLTKTGAGTLFLGAADTYTGGFTNIQAGTLQLGGAAGAISITNLVVLGSSTTNTSGKLVLGDVANTKTQVIAGLLTQGTGTANAVVGGNTSNSTLTYTGTVAIPTTFTGTLGGAGTNENNLALNITAGQLTLSGNNTYTGGTTLGGGILNVDSATAIGTGALTITGGSIDNTSGSAITLANNNAVALNGSITYGASSSLNFGTGSVVTMGAGRTVTLLGGTASTSALSFGSWNVTAPALTLTVSALQGSGTTLNIGTLDLNNGATGTATIITGNGNVNITNKITATTAAQAFTYNGTGVLTLSGSASDYSGLTTIGGAGTLRLGAGGNLPSTSGLTMTSGTFDLNGQNQTVATLTLTSPATISNTSATASTFTATNIATSTGHLSGNLSANLTLTGAAATLSGTYTNTGSLTFNSAGTGGLTVSGTVLNGGNVTFNANNTQAFTVTAPYINPTGLITNSGSGTGATTISGNIGSNVTGVTQNSATSQLTLSGVNTYTGPTTVTAGTLVIPKTSALYNNNPASWTASNIIVGNGATLALNIGGAGEFTTADLDVLLSLGGASTGFMNNSTISLDTTNAVGTLTYSSVIANTNGGANALGLIKRGTGTLVLSGVNSYSGGTTISGGTLSVSADSNLGAVTGGLTINGGGLQVTGTSFTSLNASRALTVSGAATFDIVDPANVFSSAANLAPGAGVLTKTGAGGLTLSGGITTTANIVVTGGVLNFQGVVSGSPTASTLTYGTVAGTAVVNVSNDMTLMATRGANVAGAVSVYNQTAGTVTIAPGSGNTQYVSAGGGYGYFNLTGGTYRGTGTSARFNVTAGSSTGVAYIGGTGTLDYAGGEYLLIAYNGIGALGQLTVADSAVLNRNGATQPLAVFWSSAGSYGVLNVAGGSVDNTGKTVVFGSGNVSNQTGFVNLSAGTLTANGFTSSTGTGTGSFSYINFAGGTYEASAAHTLVGADSSGNIVKTTLFGPINNSAIGGPSFSGGAIIDTNGFAVTSNRVLSGATGTGVTQSNISIPVTGNAGYIGAPAVQFSAPTGGGVPASGYALISNGQISGIVITNPGTYASGETPTITLTGGGGAIAPFATSALNTANGSAGLTKIGNGTLSLTAVNTYAGATIINGGSLSITPTSLPNTSAIMVGSTGNGALDLYADGAGAAWTLATGLNITLGSATTSGSLGFNLGTASDSIIFDAGALTINAGGGYINAVGLPGFGIGSYDVITNAASISGAGTLLPGALPGGYLYSVTVAADKVTLNVLSAVAAGDLYWTGTANSSWTAAVGAPTNWSTTSNGLSDPGYTPGSNNMVYFSAANASAAPFTTTLDNLFSVKGLRFLPSGTGAVTIAPGVGGSLVVGSDGIVVQSGAPATTTISAPLTIGAAQTLTVADSGSSLVLSGVISGGVANSTVLAPGTNVSLTITGGGAVTINNAANTFTGDILVDGGTVVVSNDRSWGGSTTVNTTSHSIILTNGGRLRVAGAVNPGLPTTTNYNLVQIGTGGATIDVLSGFSLTLDDAGQLYGTGSFNKVGVGTLILRNQTTFVGAITISEGLLQMSGTSGGFGANTAGTTIASGAALNLNGFAVTDTEPVTINGLGLASAPAGVITNGSATASSFAGPVTLGSASTIGAAAAGNLTLSGGITGPYDLTVKSTGAGTVVISGVIGTNVGQIIQNSTTGSLTLGGVANLWSGGLVIKAGTVLGGNNANTFGASTNVITLGDSSGSASTGLIASNGLTYAQPINVTAGNTGIASITAGNGTGSVTFSGPITLDHHDLTLTKTGTTGSSQFTGGLTGTGNVIINNAATTGTITLATGTVNPVGSITHTSTATGTTTISAVIGANVTGVTQSSTTSQLTLSGENLYTALTTVDAGTILSIGAGATTGSILGNVLNNGTLTFNRSNTYAYAGAISGAGGVNKLGAGTLTLTGTNSYLGATTISGGALAGNIVSNNLVLNGGVREQSGTFTRSLGTGDGQVQWAAGASGGFSAQGGALTVTFGGAPATLVWDSTANFVSGVGQLLFGSTTSDDVVTLTHNIDLNDPGTAVTRTVQVLDNTAVTTDKAVLSGIISGGANATLAKTGAGILELTGASTYSGPTTNTTGTLILSGSNSSSGAVTLTSGTIQFNSSANGGLASGLLTLTAGTVQALNAARTLSNNVLLTAVTVSGTQNLTINGSLTGAAGAARTLTSSITGGTLTLGDVALNNDATAARTLTLAGTGATVINGVISNGNSDAFANGLTVTNTNITTLNGASTYTGTTTMNAAAGTLVLGGSNSSAGATTLTTGTIQFNSSANGGLASGLLTLTAGTLQATNAARTLSNAVTLTAATVSGSQDLTFNGKVTGLTGGSRTLTSSITGGTLTLTDVDITNDVGATARALTIAGTGNTNITGVIANGTGTTVAHNLSFTSSGITTLSGANTYTGTTTINSALGTVRLDGAGKLSAGNLTITTGTLSILGTGVNQSVALLTMGGATTTSNISIGAGRTLAVTGGVTYTGTTSGKAVISGAGTLDIGANPTVNVADNTANAVDMSWEMATLTGSGVLNKIGAGTLDVSGVTTNNFSGSYQVNAGAILGLGSSGANLILNGGVYEGAGTFTRSLGTGNNQVQWLALGGGFSARGGDLTINLSGGPDPLVWGSTQYFVPDGAPLIFGSITADSAAIFANNIDLNGAVRTLQGVDNTAVTTDRGVISGIISGSSASGITKSGNGVVRLTGASTFTGSITLTQGTLEFTTASNNGGPASSLGQGTNGITLSGGVFSFVGDTTSQSTNRAITTTAAATLAANGTNGATITYAGAINVGTDLGLTLAGTTSGIISGGIIQPAGAASADLNVNSGNWTITGASSSISDDLALNGGTLTLVNTTFVINDDVVVSGPTAVLNLNSAGVWAPISPAGNSSGFYSRGGAIINLNANDVNGVANANGLDFIYLGESSTTGIGTLNTNTFNITIPRLDLGGIADGFTGVVLGTGTITNTYAANDYAQGYRLFRGSIAASLAGVAPILKQGLGEVTLSGNNSGLTGTIAPARLDSGNLVLDYSTDNNTKLNAAVGLDMRGATLILEGGVLANTAQNVTGITLANGGSNVINVSSVGAFTTTLNLGAITRVNSAGTLALVVGTSGAITTTTANHATTGVLGSTGTAFATINNGTGTYFAINNGSGTIVPLTYAAAKNDVATWQTGDHVTDSAGGFTGTVDRSTNINSLRFNGAGSSTVNIGALGILTIGSGGILQTSNVTGGSTVITGGRLVSGTNEFVINTDSADSIFRISSYLSGVTALAKAGVGTLLLDSVNHASGATNLQNGTLRITGGSAIGDRSTVTLADDHQVLLEMLDDETLGPLAGGSATAGLSTLAVVSIGSHTLTINEHTTSTYSGLLTGDGRLIKTGTATLSLGGSSTFTGDLIVNQGQVTLATRTIGNLPNVGSVTLNAGSLLLDFTGGTESSPNKINNSAPITLINTGGIDGLRANNDRADANKAEALGVVTFLGGANTITASESAATPTADRTMTITAASLVRSNRSTLLVRGQNLGTITPGVTGAFIASGRFVSTALPTLLGGAGAAGTTTISIVPWAIGGTTLTSTGTSFVTAAATTGFRPLDLTTEYEQLAAAGGLTLSNNVRLSSAASLTFDSAAARTMNSLLVDNTSTTAAITLDGAGSSLNVASGAFLFTGSATPQGITLSGFTGITTGSANEYVFHVPSTATAGVTIASPFTTATAAMTKSGAGTLILTATGSTYTGPTTVNQGVLQIDSLNKLGNLGSGGIFFNAGTLRFGAAFDLSAVPVVFGVPATGTVETTAGGTLDTNGFDVTLGSSIGGGGNGGLSKIGTGTLTLNAAASYGGATSVTAGTLAYGVANALPTTTDLTLGAATLAIGTNAATLRGFTLTGSGFITGSAPLTFTGNAVNSGSFTLTINNSAATIFDGDYFFLAEAVTARTLTLAVNGTAPVTINSVIVDGGAPASSLSKIGTGTLQLGSTNFYTGSTSISEGILRLNAAQNMAGALQFGAAATTSTAGKLEVKQNATFTSMLVQTNSTTNISSLDIDAGKTLTVTGNVVIGSGNASLTNTLFDASGAGSWVVTNNVAAATFRVGGSSGSGNVTVADLGDLHSLAVALNTTDGVFRVNSTSGTNVNSTYSVLKLAQDTTITAATLAVGDGGQYNSVADQINQMQLGTGATVLNVNTINIGTGARDLGSVTFQSPTTGTLVVRAADGIGAAAFNLGTGTATTGATLPTGNRNTFDVTGHNADLLFGAFNIGTQSARTGALENLFAFDQGTLATGNLTMGSKTAVTNSTNVLNLGGGTVTIGSGTGTAATLASNTSTGVVSSTINVTGGTVTIGSGSGQALVLASGNTNATGSAVGVLNVSGGSVVLATTGTTAATLAAASTGSSTGAINVTGGSLTSQGNILQGTGAGTRNASVTLNGGTLDMTGKNIGATGGVVTFNAQSGTLRNLGQLNGGAGLTKTTAGTLVMEGTNTYTGGTIVTAGKLSISSESNIGSDPLVTAAAHLSLNGGTLFTSATLSMGVNRGVTVGAAGGAIETAPGTTATFNSVITGTGALAKEGAGTLIFTAVNTNTGPTSVNAGVLGGSGSVGGNLVVNSTGTLAPGVGGAGVLTVTGNLVINGGGTLSNELGGATYNAASVVFNEMNAHGNLSAFVGNLPSTNWENYISGTTAHDHVQINGASASSVNGTVKISALLGGYNPVYGDIFDLMDWTFAGSLTGTPTYDFSAISLTPGLGFNTDLFLSNGIIVVVPEPSKALLLLLGLLGLMLRRRRR